MPKHESRTDPGDIVWNTGPGRLEIVPPGLRRVDYITRKRTTVYGKSDASGNTEITFQIAGVGVFKFGKNNKGQVVVISEQFDKDTSAGCAQMGAGRSWEIFSKKP